MLALSVQKFRFLCAAEQPVTVKDRITLGGLAFPSLFFCIPHTIYILQEGI